MIEKRTVFILGAGASKPYGYPTGIELRHMIVKDFEGIITKLPPDDLISTLPDAKTIRQFAYKFNKSDTNSIDLFLSRHSTDSVVVMRGKQAISSIMLHCEGRSRFNDALYETRKLDWYNYLFTRMTEHMRTDENLDFSSNQVSFVTFNYDRSLEFYLHQSLTNSFGAEHLTNLEGELKKLGMIHVHGCVARLPWQEPGDPLVLKYPVIELRARFIIEATKQIRVVGETDEDENIRKARELLKEAEQVFFLGFGFAIENLEVLDIPNSLSASARIFGTVMGFEETEIDAIYSQFGGIAQKPGRLTLEPLDSRGLLRKYL